MAKSPSKPTGLDNIQSRLAAASQLVAKIGPGVAFLVTNPLDVAYLTGFHGGDSYFLLVGGKGVLISDSRFEEELQPLKTWCRVVIRTKSIMDALGEILVDTRVKELAIQADHVTVSRRRLIADLSKQTEGLKLIDINGLVNSLRIIKDAGEVKSLKQAVRWQQESLESTLKTIGKMLKKGAAVTESHFAAVLEFEMKLRGSPVPSFETIVCSGRNGSLPHHTPGSAKIKKNVPVLIDWGAVCDGYHSDMTRVVCFGTWPKEIAKVYEIVREAHELSAAALRPGISGKAVDAIARDHITSRGYGPKFGHSLGHGIGLQIHEDPRLTHIGQAEELRPGMVVTIEPGIYLPGVGGVRLENDYLITDKGATNLCSLPMDLSWATRR